MVVKLPAFSRCGARRVLVVLLCAAGLFGCAASGVSVQELDYDPRLLTGETVFGTPVEASEAPPFDMLEPDDAMRAFIDKYVGDAKLAEARFEGLLRGLSREGYFDDTYIYDGGRTLTAAETFGKKTGNCLSYTTMFIALARAVSLNANYQIVDVPPNWDAEGGYLIRYTHINAVINGVKIDKRYTEEFTVDFNAVHPEPEYPRRRVSDLGATALFYSNRSVDHIVAGEARTGFAMLRAALELMPENVDLWLNLGAFYSKQDQPEMAVRAHRVVLEMDPSNKGAMSGLARGYERLGDHAQSEYYAEQVRNYRRKNAFFHFALAQARYERGEYASSLQSINAAIELKRRNARFHFMKGLNEQKLGHSEAAKASFQRASKLGEYEDLKTRYIRDLAGVPVMQPQG
jgi:tetratricopeptide (TPR) repeat protein